MVRSNIWLILCLALIAFSAPEAANGQEKTLSLNSRTLKSAIKKKGRFPIDIEASVRGNRATFTLTYLPVEEERIWQLKHDLSEEEFLEAFKTNNQKNLKLIRHCEYRVKGKILHAGLWHFDRKHEAPKDLGTIKTNPKTPKKKSLKQVWSAADKIPINGELVPKLAAIDQAAIDFIKANQVPGLSIAVSYHGKPIYARAFGYSDIDTLTTLKPDQPMRIFHVSWIITSAAAMKLVQDKKLNLDESVFDLLELEGPEDLDPLYKKIKVRHLMQCSGGFAPRLSFNPFSKMRTMAKALGVKDKPLVREQVIEYMLQHPLDYEPGTKQVNSSFGFMLLGRVIEEASGMSYEEYVNKEILKKLKTKSVALGKGRKEDRNKKEPSYYSRNGVYRTQIESKEDFNKWVHPPDGGTNMNLVEAGGAWTSTPADLLTIVNAIRTDDESPILDKKHIRLMFEPPAGMEVRTSRSNGVERQFMTTNGWDHELFSNNRTNSYRFGEDSGSSAYFLYRHDGFSWAVISNCQITKDGTDVCRKFASPMFEAVMAAKEKLGIK